MVFESWTMVHVGGSSHGTLLQASDLPPYWAVSLLDGSKSSFVGREKSVCQEPAPDKLLGISFKFLKGGEASGPASSLLPSLSSFCLSIGLNQTGKCEE